jgi:pseudouridine-5'-phosphate glycosidase
LSCLKPSPEVAEALREKKPVVALESSVFAQGLPWPDNLEVGLEMLQAVRDEGATPAIIWLEAGKIHYGADGPQLDRLCRSKDARKLANADVPGFLAAGEGLGATTVSASLLACDLLDLPVFATGGLGGVHRGWERRPDVSADLGQLSRARCLTVCSGVKSVLDVPATLELLETLGVPLLLFQIDHFPEFYTGGRLSPIGSRAETLEAIVAARALSLELLGRAPVVAQLCPSPLEESLVRRWLESGLEEAEQKGVRGKAVTPHLLGFLAAASRGQTLRCNCELLVANASLAARLACKLS